MVGKWRRDTSFVTATPSTVTSSSAAFGRWAFGIGQPRRDRRGRTDIVKGRSVRSGGNVLTTLSCSASGIFAICCDLTRPTITRLARTFRSTRTRRRREQYMPLVAFCLCHFLADFIICTCEFEFRQAQGSLGGGRALMRTLRQGFPPQCLIGVDRPRCKWLNLNFTSGRIPRVTRQARGCQGSPWSAIRPENISTQIKPAGSVQPAGFSFQHTKRMLL